MRGDFFFFNGLGRAGKKETSFPKAGRIKGRRINTASQSGPTKQRQNFQIGGLKNNKVLDLVDYFYNMLFFL